MISFSSFELSRTLSISYSLMYDTAFNLSFSTPQKSYAHKYVDITNGHEELIQKDVTTY